MFRLNQRRKKHEVAMMWFLWICMIFIPSAYSLSDGQRCLVDVPEVIPKKYPHYNQKSINITIDMSSRITHRLKTHIFQIFVQEVLGYERIVVNEYEDYFDIYRAVDRIHNKANNIRMQEVLPEGMINLEVWIPPEMDTAEIQSARYVSECGIGSPPGRFGWFIPIELAAPIKKFYKGTWSEDIREVHWIVLRDETVVPRFSIDDPSLQDIIFRNARVINNNNTEQYECFEHFCTKGVFVPPQCENKVCAFLLTSQFEATRFVIRHIKEMNLLVKVVWLGSNLKKTVDYLKQHYLQHGNDQKSFIILNWTPSDVILREKQFISVAFKNCELMRSYGDVDCKYEMNRLVKFSWSKLETFAKPLYQAVTFFKIMNPSYEKLLDMYADNPDKGVRDVACQWLRENSDVWSYWALGKTKPRIYIGGIFPMTESPYKGRDIAMASVDAAKAINANSTMLPDYKLELKVENGDCRADKVMKIFIDYVSDEEIYNSLIGVLGPACSGTVEPIAGVSKHYKTMVMSYSAEGASFSDRSKYPYFFRTIGENINYKYVYLELFKQMHWKRVAALTEDGQKYTEYISHMQELFKDNKITFVANTKFPREHENVEMIWYLEELKKKSARIIIADIADNDARTVMCAAFRLNMTPAHGYVWFLPMWLNVTWYDTDYFNKKNNESVNCTTAEMIKAITGYFAMSHAYFAPDDSLMQENITVGQWKKKYKEDHNGVEPTNYAGFAYDAVWSYAFSLKKLLAEDPEAMAHLHSENTTKKLVEIVEQTDFYGVSGRIKFPKGSPSRISNINIMEWYDNETHIIGQFTPHINDSSDVFRGKLELDWSEIKWFTPNGKKPDDGTPQPPACALDALAKFLSVSCNMAVVILNIIVVSVVIVAVIGVVVVVKRRYDRKVQLTKQYMKSLGIDLMNPQMVGNLDKWEIEREKITINRKLGEGAFGTVYGGEADIPNLGCVSVAVKTLKCGAATELKLDFLSEAEVMKRFDHKNIVKLLAVVTKEEPIYAIMEFMLYGDLKTYLLSRRNLAKNREYEDSEEVNSKKLTNMALDVARGLSYLAEMKYVHRDIACRNCLVDRNRMVKLGDFGMTRPMFENDYYRFHRKGMLPVRWMSPESLVCGIFTAASDVWSYGVLLYEIVTFGSFPFQGLTNAQVVELVKRGTTIEPPTGVKPQLEGLMKQCWHQDPKERPSGKEIVSFLAENPRLLHACVDVPTSLEFEDSTGFELPFPNGFRKRSSSNYKNSAGMMNGGVSNTAERNATSAKQQDNADGIINIPLDNCGPKEPLLGRGKSNSSLMNFGKLMQRSESEDHDEDPDNMSAKGHAMSEV